MSQITIKRVESKRDLKRFIELHYDLYAGNPYDWIFLWALSDEQPLYAFRSYVMEIFAVHSEKMND